LTFQSDSGILGDMIMKNLIQYKSIQIDPNRCGGRPVIAGTRVTVAQLLAELANGEESLAEICEDMGLDRITCSNALYDLGHFLDSEVEERLDSFE
jgi:uncharacterized protein (DUF433 family)